MESNSFNLDAKENNISNNTPTDLYKYNTSSFKGDCRTSLNSDLNNTLKLNKKEQISNKTIRKTSKHHNKTISSKASNLKSLTREAFISPILQERNSKSVGFTPTKTKLCGSAEKKGDNMDIMDRLSPLSSFQSNELNDGSSRANLSNNSNTNGDTTINDRDSSDTGIPELEGLNYSQIYTNTSLDVVNEMDLHTSNNQDLGDQNTNPSQPYDLLQNVHYVTENTNQLMSNPANFIDRENNLREEVNVSGVNQYNSPYLYQYTPSVEEQNEDEYIDYEGDMRYVDNVDYMLNNGIDYVMDPNYTHENTNLETNNYDSNSVFINNLDNLTQSQDQLSNTHTVSNFPHDNNMEDIVIIDELSNDAKNDLVRNNSINVLIENSDKKLDEGVMSSILRDLICPICLEYFYFPVTVACGHTFCRYCIGHSKLTGKMCPLCRQPVGRSLNINTILSNLVKSLKLRKRGRSTLSTVPDVSQVAEKIWWDEHCLKPFVSVPLFIRIMFGGMTQAPVFFDDLCSCLIDYFNTGNKWYKSKWVFTIEDFRLIRNLIGLQLISPTSDQPETTSMDVSTINDSNNVRLHHWVEDYLISNPQLCFRSDNVYPLTLKVYHDMNHKIEGTVFSALDIPYKLPWDAGRHVKSLLHFPHSSVSLSHLIFAQCPDGRFGILDVGSTIGTMIKIQGVHVLQSGDRIHIGDKHEVDVYIYKDSIGTPFKDYKWDANTNQVINYAEYLCSQQNADQNENKEHGPVKEGINSDIEVDMDPNFRHTDPNLGDMDSNLQEMDSNLQDLDSYLKIKIFADLQVERDMWICPKGVILGRGPVTQSSYKKLSITTQNGYISREHCLIYYDGSRPSGSRWLLRDMSTLGTFLKLKPFQEPLPVSPGFVFKVGQCKVEVGSPHELSRRVPSSAMLIMSQLLQSHIEPNRLVEIQSNLNVNLANPRNNPLNIPDVARLEREAYSALDHHLYHQEGNQNHQTYHGEGNQEVNPRVQTQELPGDVSLSGQVVPNVMRDDVT
uniref:E3 ubiquitin-protein ligase CHFR n=1 Tax=Theileria annulata TaxID=5874 RepID=A0A3B0NE68_THEAN